jgi:hypothetical protein
LSHGTFVFIELEDVMERADSTPIPTGLAIVRCLKAGYRLALSTRAQEQHKELVIHRLRVYGFPADFFTYVVARGVTEAQLGDDDLFSVHLDTVRSDCRVELAVTASPARAARAMHRGITAVMVGNPATAPPDFRPGRRVKAWAEIEEAVTLARVQTTEAIVPE